jgi:hypothetical protein
MDRCLPSPWNVSWNGALDNSSAASAVSAVTCVIGAASAHGARGRTSCKRQVSGSIPLTGSQVRGGLVPCLRLIPWNEWQHSDCRHGRWRRADMRLASSRSVRGKRGWFGALTITRQRKGRHLFRWRPTSPGDGYARIVVLGAVTGLCASWLHAGRCSACVCCQLRDAGISRAGVRGGRQCGSDVGVAEVVPFEQQCFSGGLGQGVRKAVPEVQACYPSRSLTGRNGVNQVRQLAEIIASGSRPIR